MILHVHNKYPFEIESKYIQNLQKLVLLSSGNFKTRVHFTTSIYISEFGGGVHGINVLEDKETIENMIENEKFNEEFEKKLL